MSGETGAKDCHQEGTPHIGTKPIYKAAKYTYLGTKIHEDTISFHFTNQSPNIPTSIGWTTGCPIGSGQGNGIIGLDDDDTFTIRVFGITVLMRKRGWIKGVRCHGSTNGNSRSDAGRRHPFGYPK